MIEEKAGVEGQNSKKEFKRMSMPAASKVPRPVSPRPPAACLGFMLFPFEPVGALTSFEFSESGQPPLNTGQAEKSETQELPLQCRHARSFQILSWNSAS